MLGPGLIGGSLVLAIRQRYPLARLQVWARRPETVAALQSQPGVVDLATTDLSAAVAGMECLVLAMPTGSMATVASMLPALRPLESGDPVLVTDVGSVKQTVIEGVAPLVAARGGTFIGSHPMAGSEKKGLDYADPDLFEQAAVILTPTSPEQVLERPWWRLAQLWSDMGARVSVLSAARHDEVVASISHLPHLLAAALVNSTIGHDPEAAGYCGGGFRDSTRIAGGPPEMWSHILADNRDALLAQLDQLEAELSRWRNHLIALDRESLHDSLNRACQLRAQV